MPMMLPIIFSAGSVALIIMDLVLINKFFIRRRLNASVGKQSFSSCSIAKDPKGLPCNNSPKDYFP